MCFFHQEFFLCLLLFFPQEILLRTVAQPAAAGKAFAKEGAFSDGMTVHRVVGHWIYRRPVLHGCTTQAHQVALNNRL